MSTPDIYMNRCISLALNGLGNVAPNPLVGSVIVYNNQIIGEGFHQEYGKAHAEVNAINSVKDKSLLNKSTLYVNLEPCAHYGKTPPCADLIIKYKLKEVIIGCTDSFSEVSGKGIEKLRKAGINVSIGVLEKECRRLNKRFFTFHEQKRPYIILKWAQTLDGFIDKKRKPTELGMNWISNKAAKIFVHKWRSQEQSIIIGTYTALNDNPRLDVREISGKNPLRIVIDKTLKLPQTLNMFDGSVPTIVFSEKPNLHTNNLEIIKIDFSRNILLQILNTLHKKNIQSIIVEGGQALLNSFIDAELWDEARVIVGNISFGEGLKAPELKSNPDFTQDIEDNKIIYYTNHKS